MTEHTAETTIPVFIGQTPVLKQKEQAERAKNDSLCHYWPDWSQHWWHLDTCMFTLWNKMKVSLVSKRFSINELTVNDLETQGLYGAS